MRLLLGSRQSILSSLPLLLVNAVGIETTIVAGRAVRRYHRCHGAEHCRGAFPCREAPRAQEAGCSRSRGSQRMPPKSLSAKSKASVALSGYFDFLKWGSRSEAPWAQTSQFIRGANAFGFHNRMDHSSHARSLPRAESDLVRQAAVADEEVSADFKSSRGSEKARPDVPDGSRPCLALKPGLSSMRCGVRRSFSRDGCTLSRSTVGTS